MELLMYAMHRLLTLPMRIFLYVAITLSERRAESEDGSSVVKAGGER